jgi:hypothetical protein
MTTTSDMSTSIMSEFLKKKMGHFVKSTDNITVADIQVIMVKIKENNGDEEKFEKFRGKRWKFSCLFWKICDVLHEMRLRVGKDYVVIRV